MRTRCKFCGRFMKVSRKEIGHSCNNHGDITVLDVGSIALCKDEFEIFLSSWHTQLNTHIPIDYKNGKHIFDYFNEPNQTILFLEKRCDVTPKNFDEWLERLKKLIVFS